MKPSPKPRNEQNLIYTFCYAKDSDDAHIAEITRVVEKNGGEIHFVLLVGDKAAIEKRVLSESRKNYGKLKDRQLLRQLWRENELFSPVPNRTSLIIDNSNLAAETAARQIIEHFGLAEI